MIVDRDPVSPDVVAQAGTSPWLARFIGFVIGLAIIGLGWLTWWAVSTPSQEDKIEDRHDDLVQELRTLAEEEAQRDETIYIVAYCLQGAGLNFDGRDTLAADDFVWSFSDCIQEHTP